MSDILLDIYLIIVSTYSPNAKVKRSEISECGLYPAAHTHPGPGSPSAILPSSEAHRTLTEPAAQPSVQMGTLGPKRGLGGRSQIPKFPSKTL